MKVKTLIILSIVFFAVGTLGGAAYAFVSGGAINILPTLKTSEEKMIDQFIAEQEKKQDDVQLSDPSTNDEDASSLQDDTTTSDEPNEKKPDSATSEPNSKRMGQPTVSDGKTLRVRATPDTQGEVLLGISNTEKVEIIDEKNGWYQIITSNGTKGWVSAEYMKEI